MTSTFKALAILAFFTNLSASADPVECNLIFDPEVVHNAMKDLNLIRPGEESIGPYTNTEWSLEAVKPAAAGSNLLVMTVALVTKTPDGVVREYEHSMLEVIAAKKVDGKLKFMPFEEAMGIDPAKDKIKVALVPTSSNSVGWTAKDFLTAPVPPSGGGNVGAVEVKTPAVPEILQHAYYVELTGPSATNARKLMAVGSYYIFGQGIGGIAVKGEKLAFDPTPGRKWHIEDAYMDLRAGVADETDNITAGEFDDNFDLTAGGNEKITKSGHKGGGFAYSFFPIEVDQSGKVVTP